MFKNIFSWIQARERHLSALAMLAGFITDSFFFGRIDIWQTHAVFAIYTAVCAIAISLQHWLEDRRERGIPPPKIRVLLPLATQFALGGFWSGFVVFYGRSADVGVSWPFLLFLALVLLGSEYFSRYHTRLVFTSVLFFLALYSYAIFALPIYTRSLGTLTFIGSGVLAFVAFALFTAFLRLLANEKFRTDVRHIRIGAFLVFIVMNLFYFSNIMPPLPLSAEVSGVYRSVWRVPGAYLAEREADQPWSVRYLGFPPTFHITEGDPLYAYSSIFAPTALTTSITHRWQWYDPERESWVTKALVTYPILGGREKGYRGYSSAVPDKYGRWRVDIEASDGRRIKRMSFAVERTDIRQPRETIALQ